MPRPLRWRVPSLDLRRINGVVLRRPAGKAGRIKQLETGHPAAAKRSNTNSKSKKKQKQEIEEKAVEIREQAHVRREQVVDPVPFFTNPTACSNGPQVATLWMDSWAHPARQTQDGEPSQPRRRSARQEGLEEDDEQNRPQVGKLQLAAPRARNRLRSRRPTRRWNPRAWNSNSACPRPRRSASTRRRRSKDTTIVFPPGMTVNPSSADGLGCLL